MRTLALLLLLLVVYATPSASQACPFGAAFCNGRHGAGCYDPIYAACHDGLICPNVTSPCLGRYGAGCYNPAYGYVLQRSGVYDAFAAVSRTTWRTVL